MNTPGAAGAERARVPGPAQGAVPLPGGGVVHFERSSLTVRVTAGGALFLGWDGAEPDPSRALPGQAPGPDARAVLEPDKDGGWRVVSERLLLTVSRHGAVEVRTPGGELLRRDLPPRWWETAEVQRPSAGGEPASPAAGPRRAGDDGVASPGGGNAREGTEDTGRDAEHRVPLEETARRGGAPEGPTRDGRWMQRSQVAADARFFGLGGRTGGPRLPDGSYPLHGDGGRSAGASRAAEVPYITMPVQLVVADAGTHLVFHDNEHEGAVTIREGQEGRGSGHDRPGSSEIRMGGGPLRYWVIAGPPARVLHGWSRLTGAPELPPGWALGYQHAVPAAGAAQRTKELASRYRGHELPLRALYLDGGTGRARRRVLRGGRLEHADLPQLAEEFEAGGVRLVPGETPRTGARTDAGHEPATGEREFTLSGSGWAGMQREGGTWGGEPATGWEGLRASLSLVVGLGLCGVPYSGPAIGGSTAAASPELYLRWFQLAAYLPLFHAHGVRGAGAREPWAFGGEVLEACAAAMAERERLRPYFTTLAHVAHRTGAPYVRPLWWQHPRERLLRECDDAFLLGDAVLVAPVLEEGARRRPVRLPYGRWYDTATGTAHDGPGEFVLDAPLSRIPVLARAGAAIPVTGSGGGVELEVWEPAPGRSGKGLVIRDEGGNRDGRDAPPAERFTVLRRKGVTEVTREDGAPAGYPVRLRN